MANLINHNLTRWWVREKFGPVVPESRSGFFEHFSPDIMKIYEDFIGPVIDSNHWTLNNGGGAGAASPAITVGAVGGQARWTTGTAGDATANSALTGGRHFRGDLNAVMMARLQFSAITGVKCEIGFRDAITNAAVVNVKATPTFTATDGVCWIIDTNHNGNWDMLGVANATAATSLTSYGVGPTASTFETFQVALIDGVAEFSHFDATGRRNFLSARMSGAVTKTVLLAPYIYVEARNGTSKNIDVDYIYAYSARTTT